MDRQTLVQQLQKLRAKQEVVDKTWRKAGNRPMLQFLVDIMPKVVEVERCSIFISDPAEDNVWVQCGTGVKERQISVPASNSLVGRAIATGEIQVETDMKDQLGAHDTVAVRTGFVTYDSMVVPVHGVTIDKVTGAIQVLNKRGGRPYTDADREILKRLALLIQLNVEDIYLRQEMGKISAKMSRQIQLLEAKLKARPAGV